MLRLILRSLTINLICIYVATQILSNILVNTGGFKSLILAAAVISVANLVVRPVVNLLLLPINLISLGLFRWVTNLATLYLVTWFVKDIFVRPFSYPGGDFKYLIIPPIEFSAFGAFIFTTLILTLIFHFVYWLLQD